MLFIVLFGYNDVRIHKTIYVFIFQIVVSNPKKMDVKKIKHRPMVCIRHLIDEPRLRHRFHIHILHPRRGNLSKPEIQKEIGKKFGITDTQQIFIYGFRTYGKRSSGFGLVYDKLEDAIKYEPNHRLVKNEIRDLGKKTKKNTEKKSKENPWCHAKKIKRLFSDSHHHHCIYSLYRYMQLCICVEDIL